MSELAARASNTAALALLKATEKSPNAPFRLILRSSPYGFEAYRRLGSPHVELSNLDDYATGYVVHRERAI